MMYTSGDLRRGIIHPNLAPPSGSVRFLRKVSDRAFDEMELLIRYSFNESSRFIDSLVLFPDLEIRDVNTLFFVHVQKGSEIPR